LNKTLKESSKNTSGQSVIYTERWEKMKQAEANVTQWDTGVELGLLQFVGKKSVQVPPNFVRTDKYIFYSNHIHNRYTS